MATFICVCKDCQEKLRSSGVEITDELIESEVLFQTYHQLTANDEQIKAALICPRCNSNNCEKTLIGYDVIGYVRGDGYLDKLGCKRDMNVFKLTTDDPYAEYRLPGETDELVTRLRRAGKHNPNAKHVSIEKGPSGMEAAVQEAITHTDTDS